MSLTPADKRRVDDAWKAIIDQYLKKAETVAREEGPGISLFRFLRHLRREVFNCDFFYAGREDAAWSKIMEWSPYGRLIQGTYDPDKMFLVCIQVPIEDSDSTTGNIRAFEFETRREIEIEFKETDADTQDGPAVPADNV